MGSLPTSRDELKEKKRSILAVAAPGAVQGLTAAWLTLLQKHKACATLCNTVARSISSNYLGWRGRQDNNRSILSRDDGNIKLFFSLVFTNNSANINVVIRKWIKNLLGLLRFNFFLLLNWPLTVLIICFPAKSILWFYHLKSRILHHYKQCILGQNKKKWWRFYDVWEFYRPNHKTTNQ